MVKKFLCCFLVFVFLFSTCSVGLAEGETDSGKVTVYDLSPQQFWGFMDKGDASVFEKNKLDTFKFSVDGGINLDYQSAGGKSKNDKNISGYFTVGILPVYTRFIDFFGSFSTIEQYLSQQGVHAKINKLFVFYVGDRTFNDEFSVPVTAYIETDSGNYFITLNEDDWQREGDYFFELYKSQDFTNKYKLKDGKVMINGQALSNNRYIKFSAKGAYVPMRDILEKLGCQVEWDKDKREVHVTANDKKMILKLESDGSFGMYDSDMNFLNDPWKSHSYNIADEKTILCYHTMNELVDLLWGYDIQTEISTNKLMASFTLNK